MELQLKGVMDDNMRWQLCFSCDSVEHLINLIKSDIKHKFINKDISDIPVYKFRHKKHSWANVYEFQKWLQINQKEQRNEHYKNSVNY